MDAKTNKDETAKQYALPLEFDAASAVIRGQHSNRIPKQQKIKNIGVLDKMDTASTKTEAKHFDSAQYFSAEFGKDEETAFREISEMLVKIERFLGAPFLNGEAFARQVEEALVKHQFLPHPILLRAKERGVFYGPLQWYFAPETQEIDAVATLQNIIEQRNFPNLSVSFSDVNAADPVNWVEQIGRALDHYASFQEKPYPHLHAICALDHPAASEFLKRKSPSQKSRWRRSAGILFTKGFREQGDVYRSIIGEVWEALIGNTDLHTLYFRRDPRMRAELTAQDAVWAHLNLAAFVDPLTQKFRWAELRATVRTLHQLLLLWRESTKPEIAVHSHFRVGLSGWGSALLKLGLKYESDMSFLLAKRVAIKLNQVAEANAASIKSSFGLEDSVPKIRFEPIFDPMVSGMLGTSEGVGPVSNKVGAFPSLAMQAAMSADGDLTNSIAVVSRLRRRTREEFEKICSTAAALGFLGVRFYR